MADDPRVEAVAEALNGLPPDMLTAQTYLAAKHAVAALSPWLLTERNEKLREALRDWLHETPMSRCNAGSDTCDTWAVADELFAFVLRSIAGQGDQ